MTIADVCAQAHRCIAALESTELWEICAAVPGLAALEYLESFWRFSTMIDPSLLFRHLPGAAGQPPVEVDKYLLRYAAQLLGLPSELVSTRKSPLQVSSGIIPALVASAREDLAATPANTHYANPLAEPLEHTAARLYLEHLTKQPFPGRPATTSDPSPASHDATPPPSRIPPRRDR